LQQCTAAELGVAPVRGPFSRYLGAHETAILLALIRSVAPKVMIEFGCNLGTTAARVLENVPSLKRYIGIDVPPHYSTALECQQSEVPGNAGRDAAHDPRFFLLMAPSQTLTAWHLEPCNAVFIDGDHSEQAVLHESRLARRLVRKGGVIIWHDYQNPAVEVTAALDKLCEEGWPISCVKESWLAFMRM
jgi:predicted O-methyltransferase YrrM